MLLSRILACSVDSTIGTHSAHLILSMSDFAAPPGAVRPAHEAMAEVRRKRDACGVTLEEIARRSKLSLALLKEFEAGDFHHWPKGIYGRAYVRTYAGEVGLDPDALLDVVRPYLPTVDDSIQSIRKAREAALPGADDEDDRNPWVAAIGTVALLAATAVVLGWYPTWSGAASFQPRPQAETPRIETPAPKLIPQPSPDGTQAQPVGTVGIFSTREIVALPAGTGSLLNTTSPPSGRKGGKPVRVHPRPVLSASTPVTPAELMIASPEPLSSAGLADMVVAPPHAAASGNISEALQSDDRSGVEKAFVKIGRGVRKVFVRR
jgi:cytoskeletal protein RodZ